MTIAVATPMAGGDALLAPVPFGYHLLLKELERHGAEILTDPDLTELRYSRDVVRARNRLAHLAMARPSISGVFWLDSDQYADHPVVGAKAVAAMVATGEDVIGAPYTRKSSPPRWVHEPDPEAEERDGLLPVRGLGFGFTYTSRRALETLAKGARIYTDRPNPFRVANVFGHLYSGPTEDDVLLSEDFSFCMRWREIGGRAVLYLRPGAIVLHAGLKAYSGADMPAVG